jgi:ribosome maturation factor RimP
LFRGSRPFFYFRDFCGCAFRGLIVQDLQSLVDKTVRQLGFELVDFEMSNRGKLLRVFIDKLNATDVKDSINIDDCVLVSNQLGNVLTVEHEIDYDRLEVSSPGMDRVLKKEQDFIRFVGERAQIKIRVPLVLDNQDARKNFLGILKGFEADCVQIECDGVVYTLPLENIDKARLSPTF